MVISITEVMVGKIYSFSASDGAVFPTITGLVIDKDKKGIVIMPADESANEPISLSFQPWIYADPIEKDNSSAICDELTAIKNKLDAVRQGLDVCVEYENDAVDGVEEGVDIMSTSFFLKEAFPYKLFNTIPYILNRNENNRLAYELIIYAIICCSMEPENFPFAYIPLFPVQSSLYHQDNIAVVRRVSRAFRKNLAHYYFPGKDLRFEGVITSFTGDHGWISITDRLTIKFVKESILDERLLYLLKQGIPATGWIEVSFSVSRGHSEMFACRITPTKPALVLARQQGLSFDSCDIPESYLDCAICGRKALPAPFLEILKYVDNKEYHTASETRSGEVIFCTTYSEENHKLVGMILCDGNIYNFHYLQICDENVVASWRDNHLTGKKVVFEPAFNHTKNMVTLNADFIRFSDFDIEIPHTCVDEIWGEHIYVRDELCKFMEKEGVSSEFLPLQPWFYSYDQLLGRSFIGKISPNTSKQKGWIYLNNGWHYGLSYSHIQDEFLYILINSPLRDSINWATVDVCFKSRKVNGTNVADNVILTNKSRLELSKRLGFELPTVAISERVLFVERKAFVPFEIDSITSRNDSEFMADEVKAQIVGYNKLQNRVKLSIQPNQQNEEYLLNYIPDKNLLFALSNDLWNDLSVSYYHRISEEGKIYPYRITLDDNSKEVVEQRQRMSKNQDKKLSRDESFKEPISSEVTPSYNTIQKEAVGIILPSSKDSTIGYIGNQYYTKACGITKYPRSIACFNKAILTFPLEFPYIYVVNYKYTENGNPPYQVTDIELLKRYVYSETGSIQISTNNEIQIQSLYAVISDKYLHREVSILLKDDTSVEGTIESYDAVSFEILDDSESTRAINVRYDDIEKIYIYGVIRPYNSINGTGRLDQFFFFHINNMETPAEAIHVKDGCAVRYCLRGVRKDNGLEGYCISIIPTETLETYIIKQFDMTHYLAIPSAIYGGVFDPKAEEIQIIGLPHLMDLNVCDYKVKLEKRVRDKAWTIKASSIERVSKLFSGILTSFESQMAVVKGIEQYYNILDGNSYQCFQQITYTSENGTYENINTRLYTYEIIYTLAKQLNGSFHLRVVKLCKAIPRVQGYLVDYSDMKAMVKTIDEYDEYCEGNEFSLANNPSSAFVAELNKRIKSTSFDYYIQYSILKDENGNSKLLLEKVLSSRPKKRFGELYKFLTDKTNSNKKFGFIVDESDRSIPEAERAKARLDYYFKFEAITNPPAEIRTWRNRYLVSFYGTKTSWGAREAHDIKILSIVSIKTPNRAETKEVLPIQVDNSVEGNTESDVSLPAEMNLKEEYGIVNNSFFALLRIYSPNYPEIKLYDNYVRPTLLNDLTDFTKGQITISATNTKVISSFEGKISTKNYIYLVRCTLEDDEEYKQLNSYSGGKIENGCSIEILKPIRKNRVASLQISDSVLHVEVNTNLTVNSQLGETSLTHNDDKVSVIEQEPLFDFIKGENLFIEDSNGAKYIVEFIEQSEDENILTSKGSINLKKSQIFRFGVITDFDLGSNWGILNDSGIKFDLSLMEKKTYNMLKTQKKRMLVIYEYAKNKILSVVRCDESIWSLLPWHDGIVSDCVDRMEEKTRSIVIQRGDKFITHYLSTMSDGYVIPRARNKLLLNEHVYIRIVSVPMQHDKKYKLAYIAPDIHCISEIEELIEYDSTKDKFYAVRNETHKVELSGNNSILKDYIGQREEILFDIQDTYLVAHIAAAGYAEEDDEIESLIETPVQNIFETSLSIFLQKKLPINEFCKIEDFNVAVHAIRNSNELKSRSEKDCCIAFAERKAFGMDQKVIINSGKPINCSKLLMRSFTHRLREIAKSSQSLDEYFFFANAFVNAAIKSINDDTLLPSYIYRILQLDYRTIVDISSFETKLASSDHPFTYLKKINKNTLIDLLSTEVKNVNCFVSHIVQFDVMTREYLESKVFPYCAQSLQELDKWMSSSGIIAKTNMVPDIIETIHQRYLRTKVNALNKITQALRTNRYGDMGLPDLIKFCCPTDAERLNSFSIICNNISQANSSGYETKERLLIGCYEKVCELISEIEEQPTLEAVELLYNTDLLKVIKADLTSRLNNIYNAIENAPVLTCACNGSSSIERKTTIRLVLENSSSAHQAAEDIVLSLESYSYGVRITKNPCLESGSMEDYTLFPGSLAVYIADIVVDDTYSEDDPIEIYWTAQYKHIATFSNGSPNNIEESCDGKITLQLATSETLIDKSHAVNMYEKYRKDALTDSTMFFGRKEEKQEIMNFLLDDDNQFVKGRIVIVYGQKKCGKTSLIYQVMNDLKEREASQSQAIIINFGTFMANMDGNYFPKDFYRTLYSKLLIYLADEISENHVELYRELKEKQMVVPDPDMFEDYNLISLKFDRYIRRFMKEYGHQYQIIVCMDEFTTWCTRIESAYKTHPEVLDSMSFVKRLSDMGFIQIIIGHANMQRALSTLGAYNQIGQFARKINITAFKEKTNDAEKVIQQPMIDEFGIDPYNSILGRRAIQCILNMTGRSPFVLMKLCDSIFKKYISMKSNDLTETEIMEVVRNDIADDSIWSLHEFNFLLEEAGDDQVPDELRSSFKYLKTVALNYNDEKLGCDADILCDELSSDENELIRGMLEDRKVISRTNNRIKINVDLFRMFILYRYGKKQ